MADLLTVRLRKADPLIKQIEDLRIARRRPRGELPNRSDVVRDLVAEAHAKLEAKRARRSKR